jgi:hypothetical protein
MFNVGRWLSFILAGSLIPASLLAKSPYTSRFLYTENGVYYYAAAVSPQQRRSGQVAGDAIAYRYYGVNSNGEHVMAYIGTDGRVVSFSYCKNPCRVVRLSNGDRFVNNNSVLIGAVFADAIHGKLRNTNPDLRRVSIPSGKPGSPSALPANITRTETGVRLRAALNSPVYATGDGVVEIVAALPGYLTMVQIAHGSNISTRYGNLASVSVSESARVAKGQVIGFAGPGIASDEAELFYEVHIAGAPVDPRPYMETGR